MHNFHIMRMMHHSKTEVLIRDPQNPLCMIYKLLIFSHSLQNIWYFLTYIFLKNVIFRLLKLKRVHTKNICNISLQEI